MGTDIDELWAWRKNSDDVPFPKRTPHPCRLLSLYYSSSAISLAQTRRTGRAGATATRRKGRKEIGCGGERPVVIEAYCQATTYTDVFAGFPGATHVLADTGKDQPATTGHAALLYFCMGYWQVSGCMHVAVSCLS